MKTLLIHKEAIMKELIKSIYKDNSDYVYESIQKLIKQYKTNDIKIPFHEKDSMIITYGDSICDNKNMPLEVLYNFLDKYIKDAVSAVHLLPMFPFSSDDGFSVIDYLKINPDLGNWIDIGKLSNKYDLMFDAVINHISKSSEWFKNYQSGDQEYENFFIECSPDIDYSMVVRPRSLPLYHDYKTSEGTKKLWTTFSEDQLDINYENPNVLIKVLEVLLEYAKNGAKYIRFDAIGFIWKKINSTCIHLEEAHSIVKIMRQVLEGCNPNTKIISETNVPHKENITYFGNGYDEAHLVYQFPLPPLTLFSFLKEDATKLSQWAKNLEETSLTEETTYFNFLASHDGIGMRPTEGILTDSEKDLMVQNTIKKGGRIGYKNNPDGTKSPYELNINYLSALCDNGMNNQQKTDKFMAAQSILLSLRGIPGIYIHSLLGSVNDIEGMTSSNINRRINREKLDYYDLSKELKSDSQRQRILNNYLRLINIRKEQTAFSPNANQEVINIRKEVFSIIRENEHTNQKILVLINVSEKTIILNTKYIGIDLLSLKQIKKEIILNPYQCLWIELK